MAQKKKKDSPQDKNKNGQPSSFWQEFKNFITRGNVIELAVGLTVGTAFTRVVNSLVNNLIMPPIGLVLQGEAFRDLYWAIDGKNYDSLAEAEAASAPIIKYGQLTADLIDFIIIGLTIFVIIKVIKRVKPELTKK